MTAIASHCPPPAARRAAGARRLLYASGGSQILFSGGPAAMRALRRLGGMVPQGDLKRGRLRKILQRPNDWRICSRHLEGEAMSGGVKQRPQEKLKPKIRNSKQIQMIKKQKIPNQLISDS